MDRSCYALASQERSCENEVMHVEEDEKESETRTLLGELARIQYREGRMGESADSYLNGNVRVRPIVVFPRQTDPLFQTRLTS